MAAAAAPMDTGDSALGKSKSGRLLTRLRPQREGALLCSSGWENLHFVDKITRWRCRRGVRFAMPTFFVTNAPWGADRLEGVRGAVGRQDVAAALLQHVLAPEDTVDQAQFTLLWHAMFAAPLHEEPEDWGV